MGHSPIIYPQYAEPESRHYDPSCDLNIQCVRSSAAPFRGGLGLGEDWRACRQSITVATADAPVSRVESAVRERRLCACYLTVPPCWKREFVDIEVRRLATCKDTSPQVPSFGYEPFRAEVVILSPSSEILIRTLGIISLEFFVTQQKGAGRPKTVIIEEAKAVATEAFQRSPKKFIRQYQRESGVSYGSVQRLLKEMNWRP
ncbi:hypothetical protein ANN_23323 [Periplaneta americana]|uniref:Uncharacterized protein n=1 Tax=Periplaneta americana TaxID=6978 RepID=A0ABQ8SKS4_PERAM|nr:hypothetical protein ANN_23323 [Periplaneta americana]